MKLNFYFILFKTLLNDDLVKLQTSRKKQISFFNQKCVIKRDATERCKLLEKTDISF